MRRLTLLIPLVTVAAILSSLLLGGAALFGPSGCSSNEPVCAPERIHTVVIGPEDQTFHVGPYLMHTTTTTVEISWETVASGDTVVEYGRDAPGERTATGEPGTMHRVRLADLRPATHYYYRACTDGTCTGDLSFSTAPERAQPFRFAVLGDSRSDPATHRLVVDGIVASQPAMVINVGDVVGDGNNREEYKTMHFDPARQLGHYVPIYVAVGNHEAKESGVPTFRDYMSFPHDPEDPAHETSYTVTYGDAFFVVYDTTGILFAPFFGDDTPLWAWLKEQVTSEAALKAKWRFAFMHHPPDSRCEEVVEFPSLPVRDYVMPLFREHGFHALFAGHVHTYERLDFDGFPVIITGGGGAGLRQDDGCLKDLPASLVQANVHHYTTVDLACDSAHIRAVDLNGSLVDELTLTP